MMYEHLIVLGAGATAALSDAFPVGRDFFSSNQTWSRSISDYPHLAVAQRKVKSLKDTLADTTPVSLTDAWIFLDTVFKYHCATRRNSTYDYRLLRIRYAKVSKDNIPAYVNADYLNGHYEELCSDMHPFFSTLPKRIYDTCDQTDPVAYFLLIAGWELKHLLYRTYHPEIQHGNLYTQLLQRRRALGDVAVISFNYDIFFEMSCSDQGVSLELLLDSDNVPGQAVIPFCKLHGGWNIRHLNQRVEPPYRSLADFVEDQYFDKLPALEERPAMIPYFSHPDEISELHESRYPDVSMFFLKQQERMRTLLNNARTIASIGYSFSDIHVKEIVQGISSGTTGRGKRLLCVMKDDSEKDNIMRLWEFKDEDGITFKYHPSGFDNTSIADIMDFFNTRK